MAERSETDYYKQSFAECPAQGLPNGNRRASAAASDFTGAQLDKAFDIEYQVFGNAGHLNGGWCMGRLLALCAGILALATLVPAAWSQETPAPADPLAQALTVIQSPASQKMFDLQAARQYLVDQRQVARPMVVELLGNADTLVRMNAAIILSDMATAGDTSTATLEALKTAAKDKDLAVAYWGFQGLMNDGVSAADQRTVIREMMKMERPRASRLAALATIGEKKLKPAAPIIVSHLQKILKEYMAQVETQVTTAETLRRAAPTTLPPTGVEQMPSTGVEQMPPRGVGPEELQRWVAERKRRATGVREMPPTGEGQMPASPRGRRPGSAFTPPGGVTSAPAVSVEQVRRADLPNMSLDQLQALAQGVEAMPTVAEVHQMGLVLEDIVSSVSPGAPLFDFKTTPPWDLDKCVDKAVIYMNGHRSEYGAETEAPTPAAPPTTGTAPATTAATPASTTPAP